MTWATLSTCLFCAAGATRCEPLAGLHLCSARLAGHVTDDLMALRRHHRLSNCKQSCRRTRADAHSHVWEHLFVCRLALTGNGLKICYALRR